MWFSSKSYVTALFELLAGDNSNNLERPKENSNLSDYRIAIWWSHEVCPVGNEVREAMKKVVAVLEAAGATIDEIEAPVDPLETYSIYLKYLSPFMRMHMPNEQKKNVQDGRASDSYPSDIRSPFPEMDMAGDRCKSQVWAKHRCQCCY